MPEFHPSTTVEIPDGVPSSGFRCAIPNPKRYMKQNAQTIEMVCEASYKGDYDKLSELLATGDEDALFNGDLNQHTSKVTALHMAAMMGQTECVELLLKAKADPHIRECVPHGQDPEDGKTALMYARDFQWDDCAEILEQAEKSAPYSWYVPFGPMNNAKQYDGFQFQSKPAKGFFSGRPGAAEKCGFDPKKYGTGALPEDFEEEVLETPVAKAGGGRSRMPSVGLLFPGQGSQYVKMLTTVKDIPEVLSMLDRAQEILGWDVLELCQSGPENKLEETMFCQPAMFIAGLAGVEKLRMDQKRSECADRFGCAAGLSLGEYTALCAAGVFSFEDGLRLVKLRGEAMQEAATVGKQAMLSVAGIGKEELQDLCEKAVERTGPSEVCTIANELFPKGFSCAGTEAAIQILKELSEEAGALQAKVLKTSGAFHTSLMAPAQEKLAKALDEMLPRMRPPVAPVYMNTTAQPLAPGTDPKAVVDLLKKQLTSPVLWEASVRAMIKAGVTDFFEVGPMKQIKAMMKRIDSKVWGTTTNIEV